MTDRWDEVLQELRAIRAALEHDAEDEPDAWTDVTTHEDARRGVRSFLHRETGRRREEPWVRSANKG